MAVDAPVPVPSGVAAEGAIELCRQWMTYLGAQDTVVAEADARKACDLYSRRFVAWVDNHRGNLDVTLVTHAAHVSAADGRRPLIFVRGGVLPEAKRVANENGVALFSYVAVDGSLEGANALGYELRAQGLA